MRHVPQLYLREVDCEKRCVALVIVSVIKRTRAILFCYILTENCSHYAVEREKMAQSVITGLHRFFSSSEKSQGNCVKSGKFQIPAESQCEFYFWLTIRFGKEIPSCEDIYFCGFIAKGFVLDSQCKLVCGQWIVGEFCQFEWVATLYNFAGLILKRKKMKLLTLTPTTPSCCLARFYFKT